MTEKATRTPGGVDGYVARTVPVRLSIEPREVVLSQPEMEGLLGQADRIAVKSCECRGEKQGCARPLEVCLVLDDAADEDVRKGEARLVSPDEALAILERSHTAGLVHLAYRLGETPVQIICSCCPCCCWFLLRLRDRGFEAGVIESAWVASFDPSACLGCRTCLERCPFGAWRSSEVGVDLDRARCFGCGLCVSTCPAHAVRLVERGTA